MSYTGPEFLFGEKGDLAKLKCSSAPAVLPLPIFLWQIQRGKVVNPVFLFGYYIHALLAYT
jgi:hypothetical protein